MNFIRDETINILQFIHISTVLSDLINGLDTRLRGYDKSFRTSSSAGMTSVFAQAPPREYQKVIGFSLSSSELGVPGCHLAQLTS
ncbi:MAG: hypothetical protein RBS43_03390 [Candidatus Cloacimonas sp.]|nr:hypothetical protein [Candidatus Cloacimonas sp.]